jgi:hypothetical protein
VLRRCCASRRGAPPGRRFCRRGVIPRCPGGPRPVVGCCLRAQPDEGAEDLSVAVLSSDVRARRRFWSGRGRWCVGACCGVSGVCGVLRGVCGRRNALR